MGCKIGLAATKRCLVLMRAILILPMLAFLAACQVASPPPTSAPTSTASSDNLPKLAPDVAMNNFRTVVAKVEPIAEDICRQETPDQNCNFTIAIERDRNAGINAFQTLDNAGNPYLVFTIGLIEDARNIDELAFVMGHEAAHHIARHIPRQRASAQGGALIFGVLAGIAGGDASMVQNAADIGATVGARRFSQDHELQADALGTVIAYRAGFDPERGAQYFTRLPDPGETFLGTHPPNANRIQIVRDTMADLR